MASPTTSTYFSRPSTHGGTSLGAHPADVDHRLGNALHAVRTYAGAAVQVAVFGEDGMRYVINPLLRWRPRRWR
ncbi:hypothetical protein [Streptomyces sp. NBC_01190]|uniref:hypothetical protein n=1 Tax=Streptomyces sp. NBC_01190 TaxID=2903767 RepID=UPI00386E10DA|nr:hypothetical protein OG519_13005 [Streptomyces sp. NBC_01190]